MASNTLLAAKRPHAQESPQKGFSTEDSPRNLSRKRQRGFGVCALICGCFVCFVVEGFVANAAHAQDADAAVKFRKALMQETKASLQAFSLLLKGEVADKESLALQAQILALASERAGEAFVFRTRGLIEKTTAHERVWTEQAKFRKKMDAFAKDARAFADLAARPASAKELGSAFKGLAKQCKSCHDRYRVENN